MKNLLSIVFNTFFSIAITLSSIIFCRYKILIIAIIGLLWLVFIVFQNKILNKLCNMLGHDMEDLTSPIYCYNFFFDTIVPEINNLINGESQLKENQSKLDLSNVQSDIQALINYNKVSLYHIWARLIESINSRYIEMRDSVKQEYSLSGIIKPLNNSRPYERKRYIDINYFISIIHLLNQFKIRNYLWMESNSDYKSLEKTLEIISKTIE